MHNMLIRPSIQEIENFGEPDFVIFNAGEFPANRYTAQMTSKTSIDVSFEKKEMLILGTEYAGEMKKGVFTVLNYLMPKQGVLSMHCSANEGEDGGVALFFGLSGTGKTTLSADKTRQLIGDDEHCWTPNGIFNIEGGCYAKCINLSAEKEPEIYKAIRFGSVLENVVYDPESREVDYTDSSITENTRCSYPIEFIENAKLSGLGGHPNNIVFLSCDAFGVLPPVSLLTPEQVMYHFISGYTSKLAGTEMGIKEPQATFSACFGAAFIVCPPIVYARLLADKVRNHKSNVWLINTGWCGGDISSGSRMSLKDTRAIINAIHDGSLAEVARESFQIDSIFNLKVPLKCGNIDSRLLTPSKAWKDAEKYKATAIKLARLFKDNFEKYRSDCPDEVQNAGPIVTE
jgi:phosphoenolpyruvate carboxykinase (ATP)